MISILFQNPNIGGILIFVFVFLALVISISIHEFAHAFAAYKLGDPTAKYLGRLTLKPSAHLDPIGTLLLVFVGFGWGKPVPFSSENLVNPKRDAAIISIAGPLSNFLLAIVLALLFHLVKYLPFSLILSTFLYLTILYNIMLGVFNLIPIHPLDGFKVVYGLLPPQLAIQWMQMEQFGLLILIFLIFTRSLDKLIFSPITAFIFRVLGIQIL